MSNPRKASILKIRDQVNVLFLFLLRQAATLIKCSKQVRFANHPLQAKSATIQTVFNHDLLRTMQWISSHVFDTGYEMYKFMVQSLNFKSHSQRIYMRNQTLSINHKFNKRGSNINRNRDQAFKEPRINLLRLKLHLNLIKAQIEQSL